MATSIVSAILPGMERLPSIKVASSAPIVVGSKATVVLDARHLPGKGIDVAGHPARLFIRGTSEQYEGTFGHDLTATLEITVPNVATLRLSASPNGSNQDISFPVMGYEPPPPKPSVEERLTTLEADVRAMRDAILGVGPIATAQLDPQTAAPGSTSSPQETPSPLPPSEAP